MQKCVNSKHPRMRPGSLLMTIFSCRRRHFFLDVMIEKRGERRTVAHTVIISHKTYEIKFLCRHVSKQVHLLIKGKLQNWRLQEGGGG